MEIIARGAEANLYLTNYLGNEALVKERIAKGYRNKILDGKIRKLRTKQECVLLNRAKEAGVRTPVIYKVDRKEMKIIMEFIRGKKLRDFLGHKNIALCTRIGHAIGKLHSADIVHGDLTTSNILLRGKELVFVDFGLGLQSGKIEDKAVDLLVLKKTFMATHFKLSEGWGLILKGYCKAYSEGNHIVKHIEKVEARVRYH